MLLRKSSGRETNTFTALQCVHKTNLHRSGPMHFKPVLYRRQLILFLKEAQGECCGRPGYSCDFCPQKLGKLSKEVEQEPGK